MNPRIAVKKKEEGGPRSRKKSGNAPCLLPPAARTQKLPAIHAMETKVIPIALARMSTGRRTCHCRNSKTVGLAVFQSHQHTFSFPPPLAASLIVNVMKAGADSPQSVPVVPYS